MSAVPVSLIIPTYNRGAVLRQALNRALAQRYPNLEIIVVDQTSAHPSDLEAYLRDPANRFQYYRLAHPSVTVARNFGIQKSLGHWIIFIDDDVVIEPDFVTTMVKHFATPSVGGVMPFLKSPTSGQESRQLTEAAKLFEVQEAIRPGSVVPTSWLSNSAVAYTRDALVRAGLFDEYFQGSAWCEDADMSVRVRALGFKLLFDTRVSVLHLTDIEGGCGNRNSEHQEQITQEHLNYYQYFVLKNRRFLGSWTVAKNLYRQYRYFAFNRAILQKGIGPLWRRQKQYAVLLATAWQDARHALKAATAGSKKASPGRLRLTVPFPKRGLR